MNKNHNEVLGSAQPAVPIAILMIKLRLQSVGEF